MAAAVPVVKIGRMGAVRQSPDPAPHRRSPPRGGVEIPATRRCCEKIRFTPEAAGPDRRGCSRRLQQRGGTLTCAERFASGGYARPPPGARLEQGFVGRARPGAAATSSSPARSIVALACMKACGADAEGAPGVELREPRGAPARYERALNRIDTRTGLPDDLSAILVGSREGGQGSKWCPSRVLPSDSVNPIA